MTAPSTFRAAEIAAVAGWAAKGVRLAMVAKPDGTKIIMAAADVDAPADDGDVQARMEAFARCR